MNKKRGITCSYKVVNKNDSSSVNLIEQGEEGR